MGFLLARKTRTRGPKKLAKANSMAGRSHRCVLAQLLQSIFPCSYSSSFRAQWFAKDSDPPTAQQVVPVDGRILDGESQIGQLR